MPHGIQLVYIEDITRRREDMNFFIFYFFILFLLYELYEWSIFH